MAGNFARLFDVAGGVVVALAIVGLFQAGVRDVVAGNKASAKGRLAFGLLQVAAAAVAAVWLILLREVP